MTRALLALAPLAAARPPRRGEGARRRALEGSEAEEDPAADGDVLDAAADAGVEGRFVARS